MNDQQLFNTIKKMFKCKICNKNRNGIQHDKGECRRCMKKERNRQKRKVESQKYTNYGMQINRGRYIEYK